MSSRKGSSKRNSSSHSSSGDSSANEVIAPKEEFEVEEEAKDAYYKALCGSTPPSKDIPIPKRPVRSPNAPLTPSMVSHDYLTTLRDFYQIPSGVVFRIPSGNERAKNPPEGFFTCYEAFMVYCRMWFPIPGTIVRALHHFGLSISQLSVPALQHWLGVLISSYELGMDLNPGDFEGFWSTRGTGIDGPYRMAPKKGMAIIQGHTSHPKAWFERFFFVRIDGESVEESYLPLFRREWILPPTRANLFAKRDLLRSRPFFLNSFTVERIRSAVELQRSRAVSQPLDVPYDVEPAIDVLPAQRQRIRSRKGKGVASENVLGNLPLPEWNPSFSPGERSGTSEVPLPSDFFADLPPGFTTHKSLDEESRRKVVAEGSSLINEDPRAVLVGLLVVLSAFQYLNNVARYNEALATVKRTPAYKNRLKALELERTGGVSSKKKGPKQIDQKLQEELSNELDLQIKGAENPSIWDLLGVRFVLLPYTIIKLLVWYSSWVWRYKVKKAPYSLEDASYLTRRSLGVPLDTWTNLDEYKKEDLLQRRLWEKQNLENYYAEMRKESKRRR
ncbi:hypothetical protein F2Q68_00025680 [Brassica cretica]|uniref:Uncharacterized protein n=1 Tax=Brassica cretica TaxID=69181 RepID=A0A8S9I784_BRACR|nr:hypothetical protein F2Q68_00025680 [Brassica cretica]